MSPSPLGRVVSLTLLALAGGASASVFAGGSCDLITRTEASRLLGTRAGQKVPLAVKANQAGCLIDAADGSGDTLTFRVTTLANGVVAREHMDDERGDEVPSMHGEPWYEVSVPDRKHPEYRRLVIHRDRTSLTFDLRSSHQSNAKRAFESVWYKIAERLPAGET